MNSKNYYGLIVILWLMPFSLFAQNNVIFPLTVGNEWFYIDSIFSDGTTLTSTDTIFFKIIGETDLNYLGITYHAYKICEHRYPSGHPLPISWLINNQSDGLWEYGITVNTDTIKTANLCYKYPTFIGDTASIMVYYSNAAHKNRIECVDTNATYSTPAGDFQCIVYKIDFGLDSKMENGYFFSGFMDSSNTIKNRLSTGVFYVYQSPNVGRIAFESFINDTLRQKTVLLNYNLLTKITKPEPKIINKFKIGNFPNPFNATTTISFELPKAIDVQVKIYDVSGSLVEMLFDGRKSAGRHKVSWNAENVSSGLYFYAIEADGFIITQKCLLLK